MVKKKGTALLIVFTDVDIENETEFNAWYNQEHVPERLSAPGFLDAARYEALRGGPRYLAVYELETVDALQTDEYLNMSRNPTEWTKRMSPNAIGRGTVRNVCTQIYPEESDPHTLGRGMAPALQIGRMDVPVDIEAKYNEYYDTVRHSGQPADSRLPPRSPLPRGARRPQVPYDVRVRARKGAGNPGVGEPASPGHHARIHRRLLRPRSRIARRLPACPAAPVFLAVTRR